MFPQGPRLIYTLHKELRVKAGEVDFLRAAHALKCEEIVNLISRGTIHQGHVTGASSQLRVWAGGLGLDIYRQ